MTSVVTTTSRALSTAFNAVRGFLIGLAELVPGVSGGTIALLTGVYEQIIDAAGHVLTAVRRLVTGPDRGRAFAAELRRTDWWLVIPVLVGMATAVLTVAGPVEHLVSTNPEVSRGLFFGLVAASLAVPLRMLPAGTTTVGGRIRDVLSLVLPAAVAFYLVGLAGDATMADPPAWLVFIAAAIAICALVVPGVSGSFFLLAIGLYSPTLQAVDQRDLGYIAVFGAGAIVGLVSIVQVLRYLLSHRRRITLLVMTGLMLGSMRALWPWQASTEHGDATGGLVAPYAPIVGPILMALVGVAAVVALLIAESRFATTEQHNEPRNEPS